MKFSTAIVLLDFINKEFSFPSPKTLQSFLKREYEFWSKQSSKAGTNPHASSYILKYQNIKTILDQITAWEPEISTWDSSALYSNFQSLIQNNLGRNWLWSGHPFLQKWLDLIDTSSVYTVDAFFEAIVGKSISRISNNIDYFQGYLLAYEYINQNDTSINRRRSSEKKSLTILRDQLEQKNNELIDDVDEFKNEFLEWRSRTQEDFSSWFEEKKKLNDDTVLVHSKNFHEQVANWTNRFTELENLFREKLRFEGAAKYWGDKVKVFKTQGYIWAFCLVFSIGMGIFLFSKFFLAWLQGQPSGLSIQSIEGVLIFAVILSSYAFLIKALSKLTFSTFHLMRDAEEREQLTHLYISLREGNADDPEARKIILQALFSRSDTGLLAGDHSPTMPTVQDAIKIVKP